MINIQRDFTPGGGVKAPEDYPAMSPLPYGLFSAGLKIYPVLLDQARQAHEIKISGNVIWAYLASDLNASFSVQFNTLESDGVTITEGFFIAGPKFSRLYLTHAAQAGKYIYLLYTEDGRDDVRVINPNQSAATVQFLKPGTFDSIADVACGVGQTLVIAADNTRHTVTITNLALNPATLRIGDNGAAAANGQELVPGESIILKVTAAIYAWNPGILAQSVSVVSILN